MTDGQGEETPLLSCKSVTKLYGAMAAVDKLSFEVRQGEVLGIGGPNGAGKTTLFDLISGLSPANEGRIMFEGHDLLRHAPHQICHLGISRTFQLNAAFDTMTVRENVLCASYYGHRNVFFPKFHFDRAARARAEEAIAYVGLGDAASQVARQLPVLQRKQVMIACALVSQPKLLLMDEPVGGLNPHEIDEMLDLLRRVRRERGLSIILIEHVMRFLVALSDRIMIMHHGQKIYEGSAKGLAEDRTVVEVYLGEGMADHLRHQLAN